MRASPPHFRNLHMPGAELSDSEAIFVVPKFQSTRPCSRPDFLFRYGFHCGIPPLKKLLKCAFLREDSEEAVEQRIRGRVLRKKNRLGVGGVPLPEIKKSHTAHPIRATLPGKKRLFC